MPRGKKSNVPEPDSVDELIRQANQMASMGASDNDLEAELAALMAEEGVAAPSPKRSPAKKPAPAAAAAALDPAAAGKAAELALKTLADMDAEDIDVDDLELDDADLDAEFAALAGEDGGDEDLDGEETDVDLSGKISTVEQRIAQCKQAAAVYMQTNREYALQLFNLSKTLGAALTSLQAGQDVDMSTLPKVPPAPAQRQPQQQQQAPAQPAQAQRPSPPRRQNPPAAQQPAPQARPQQPPQQRPAQPAKPLLDIDFDELANLAKIPSDDEDDMLDDEDLGDLDEAALMAELGDGDAAGEEPSPQPHQAQPQGQPHQDTLNADDFEQVEIDDDFLEEAEQAQRQKRRPTAVSDEDGAIKGSSSPASSPRKSIKKKKTAVKALQKRYDQAARQHAELGDEAQAKYCQKVSKTLNTVIQVIESGADFDMSQLPEEPQQPGKKSEQEQLKEKLLTSWCDQLQEQAKTCLELKRQYLHQGKKKEAEQFENSAKRFLQDKDTVTACLVCSREPPGHSYKDYTFPYERRHLHLSPTDLEVEVVQALSLIPPKGYKEKNMEVYVVTQFAMTDCETQKHQGDTVRGSVSPKYEGKCKHKFKITRDKKFERFVKRGKVTFELYQHRFGGGLLFKDICLGSASVPLQDLMTSCELHHTVEIKDPDNSRKSTGSSLQVVVRLCAPLQGKDMQQKQCRWLFIDRTTGHDVNSAKQEAAVSHGEAILGKVEDIQAKAAAKAQQKAEARISQAATAGASSPARAAALKIADAVFSPEKIVSFEVLKKEQEEADRLLAPFAQLMLQGKDLPEDVQKLNIRRMQLHKQSKVFQAQMSNADGSPNVQALQQYVGKVQKEAASPNWRMAIERFSADPATQDIGRRFAEAKAAMDEEIQALHGLLQQFGVAPPSQPAPSSTSASPERAPTATTPTAKTEAASPANKAPSAARASALKIVDSIFSPEKLVSYEVLKQERDAADKVLAPYMQLMLQAKPLPENVQPLNIRRMKLYKRTKAFEASVTQEDGSPNGQALKEYVLKLQAELPNWKLVTDKLAHDPDTHDLAEKCAQAHQTMQQELTVLKGALSQLGVSL